MRTSPIFKFAGRIFVGIVCTVLFCTYMLYRIDTLTLWSILPGVTSSKEVRESAYTMVSIAEELPEEEAARNMAVSMTMFGAIAYAAKTAQDGEIDDQIISQYTLGLVKGAILQEQGDLSAIEYQLLKLPFQTGNTKIMKKMLSVLQKRTQLPEGLYEGKISETERYNLEMMKIW